jgi:nucleotide-binding universal stress UspA family protein
MRLLVVVDGTERTNRVLDYIVTLAQGRDAIEVVVLNVQSKREEARLRGYQSFKQEEVDDRLINDLGTPIVSSVCQWLDKAAIQNRSKVLIGDPVPTILQSVAEEDCDCIVIGDRRSEGIRRWIAMTAGLTLGSPPVSRLLAAANTPVVVVK